MKELSLLKSRYLLQPKVNKCKRYPKTKYNQEGFYDFPYLRYLHRLQENYCKTKAIQQCNGHYKINDVENYKFTNREREVILLLVKGYSYKRISEELVISFTTARTHGYNIYQKAGIRNKVELVNLMKQYK
jgi:DNA-binding NarL/FixJ family response regulator